MELSPIYEALKRCLYPAIEPLIYTNYHGFNASSPFQRVVQDRIANSCHRTRSFRCVPRAQQNILASVVRWLTLFQRFRCFMKIWANC